MDQASTSNSVPVTAEPQAASASVVAYEPTTSASNSLSRRASVRGETSMATTSERSGHPFLVDDNDVEDKEGLHVRKKKHGIRLS